jgi:DNA-binding transcriptional MerR regulator
MELMTTKDILERFQIPYHRLAYLFASRRVPEVRRSSSGGRVYGEQDLERIRMALEDIERSKGLHKAALQGSGRSDLI